MGLDAANWGLVITPGKKGFSERAPWFGPVGDMWR